ncbi:MAG: alkaline phosphatase family protein [Anaerolineae bacterium]|nr:alkaline phosphatase family protein [Gemmatimonadaceae bacterium]
MLVLLQFDSSAQPLIERMLEDGRLPALASLRSRGSWQAIDTDATFLESSTYPTLCTGIDVREHGLYSAFPWSAADQRARFVQAFPKPRTIWERLTERGRRSLIVDPFLAWPPRSMAGVYLSGMHFEDRMVVQARSVPRGERRALARRYGRSPGLDDVYGTRNVASLLAWRDHLIAGPGRVANEVIELLSRDSFELLWLTFPVSHKAGHHLWDPASVIDEPMNAATEQRLRGGLAEVYMAIDAAIGRVLDALPDHADVIVFSPTGMGPNTSRGDLLPDMLDAVLAGTARKQAVGQSRGRAPVWSLRSNIPPSWRSWIARALPDRVVADLTTRLYTRADWATTRAMAVPGENKGYVRINLRGREREGVIEAAEVQALSQEIAHGLMTFRDADGAPTIGRVERMSDMANGRAYHERLPDLVVFWGESPAARLGHVSSSKFGELARRGVGSGRSGNHNDDAWAIVVPGRSRMRALGRPMRITDIGATACSVLSADLSGLSGESLLETV